MTKDSLRSSKVRIMATWLDSFLEKMMTSLGSKSSSCLTNSYPQEPVPPVTKILLSRNIPFPS
ncbi:hypothetical protein D3C75_1245340 [compost metagenome]